MADKVGLGSGSVPPQIIPPAQADASKVDASAGAEGAESPSQYFYEIAQSGYEFLAKYAQAAAEAQKPKELKPEEAAAHFDQAEKEFQSTYKDAGTGPAAEAQAKSKIDAMQAAMPALMEQAKDPEVQAYLKEFQGGEAAEAKSGDAAGTDASQQWGAPVPKDPAKAKAAFEILSRLRALEQAKHQYYSKYHKGSQDDLARRSLEKQQKLEARLKEVGEELRSQPDSVEAQRLLVAIDKTIGDDFALRWDLEAWKKAAQGLKDPAAKVEELNSVLKVWSELGDNMLGQGAAEMQAKIQSLKDEIVATLRDNPKLISVDNKPVPNGAEHVRVMLDRIFPSPPSDTILQPELLSGLSLEGMKNFAQLSVEADAAMLSAMQKSQAGDAQGAKEDYLKALGAYAELRDEAAARAMDREIRKLLGRGDAPIEDYKMLGRIHAELKGSGLKLEAELKEEIASPEWMGFFLESSMKVTNRHLRGADSKVADDKELAEIMEVAEDLIQAVKIRQEAGIANDDPVQLMEIDRLQLVMRKNADAKKLGSKERLELREKVVRLDVARFPEYVDALTRPIRGAWEPGLLDRIAHPERSGAIGVGIVAEDIGREMLEHLKAWEEDLDHSRLEPKAELDRRADMSAVLSLFYPLTKIGENPPLNQEELTPLVRRNAEHLQALASQVIAERFPMVARQPELLQAIGEDVSALSQEAVQRGDASFAALLRNPKGLEAFVAMSYKAYDLETRAKTLEAKVEAAKLKKLPEEKSAKWQAEALQLRMQAAELYSKRGGPPERVKTVLKPAMDFFEGVAADPHLTAAERAESLLDIAKLYQAVRLPEEAARVYEKIVAMERDRYLSGTVDEGLQTAATLAQGHRALLKEPPDYDAAKKFFQSLPGVEEAQRSYDAIVAYQRSQRLPKVLGALEAVAAEYAQNLEQRKGKAEADKFRAEFKARAELFRGKLESGDYRAIEDLFAAFGYVRHDAHQGRDFYKWAVGEGDSIDWREFNEKSLSLLQTATNPEATDRDFAALGLEMGTYLGSAGDFDLFQAGAKDVAYFGAASQILDMMGNDQYVGAQAKSYRTGIANRSVIHETGVFLGNLSVVGAESLSEAGKSAALWLVPAGVGRLAGAGARLVGAGERLSILANVAASSLSGMLVESAWTGNWDAFSAKGLATTGTTTFISYFGYRHIARLSQKLGEAAKRSSTFGQRVAGQAAIGFSTRVMLEMGEFTAGGLFEAGMSFAQEGLGIQKVSELEQEASLILRIFSKVLKGGFEEKRENLGEGFAGRLIDFSTGGRLHAVEQKAQLQDRQADIESAARAFGWDLDFNAAKAWIEERRPVDGAKPGEKELAALLAMDSQRLEAVSKDPAKIAQAKEAVQKLYPELDPNSWEAQLRAFQVLDYFEVKGKKGIAEQFAEFQKSAESLGIRSPEHLSAYYELAFRGLTPKQAKQMAKELAATPKLNDQLDVLVDAYVQPGAKLTDDLRETMRAEVVLSLLEEAVASKKSPRALLERDVQAATPLAKAPEATPEAGPYRTQANFAGLPWTLGDIYEGLAKLLGITTRKAAKERGWKELDAWVEATSSDRGPSSDAVSSEALAKAVAQGGKKTARAADTLVEGSGITHPGLSEKLQLRFERMGLDAGQISALAKQSAKFQKGLRAIAEGLLGEGALATPQGQLLAAELLLKAVEFGDHGKDPAKALQYFQNVAQDLREAKPQLDAAAERLFQARDVHQSPAAYSVKTTLFLKALQDAATGKKIAASLASWTEPSLLGRIAEVLLEAEATGVSTPEGRGRIAKKFIALLGAAGSPKALLGALYPAEARPIPLNPQGIASVEEVGGRARTKYAEIEVEAGKAWLFPNPGRKVEVYNPVTKTWVPAKEGQPLKSGTWIRQEGRDLGRKLFTLTPEGEVYLEEIGSVARRMEEGGSVMRDLYENFPAWFGAGEALSMRDYDDLTKIVPEFFRRVEGDRNPDWDRWYAEIEGAVSALEPAVQALPEHKQAEFRIALMRKLAGGKLTAERARAIAEEVLKSPLDPALFLAGDGGPFGDFFGAFEAQQPKQDYGEVFGDEAQLGVHGLPDPEIDVFGEGTEMSLSPEQVVPLAIAAAEEDWWLGSETPADTDLTGGDAVENVIPLLPPQRSKAPTVKYPDQLAAARLGQPEAIAEILGQEAMAEGMRQMEAALQAADEPAQIFIRLPEGESREDALVAVSEKADALKLTLEDFGGPGELVFLTPTGRKVLVKVEVEGAAPKSPPPKPLFQEEDEAEADAYYDEVLRALQHDTDPSGHLPSKSEAAPPSDEKDLLHGPVRDRMAKALTDFLGMQVNRARMAEAFPDAAEVFRVFEEAGELIKRIERSDWGSKDWADLRKGLEALRTQIEAADALWVQSQSVKYYMSFLDTAFTPLLVRAQNAPAEAEIPLQAIQTPEWLDSPDFELGMLDDAARAREGKPPRFDAPAMVFQTTDAEAVATLEAAVLKKAEALGLELVAKKPGKLEFRTPMGGGFEVKIEAVPRRVSLDPQADKIPLGPKSYLERSGDRWIFKNPGKESWFIGTDARGMITEAAVLRDGDLLVSFDGQAVVLEDPVLRAKPAFRVASGVSALKIPEHPFDKIPPPQELRDHGIQLGRNFEKIEVTYQARPGEKLLIRRPGQTDPIELKPLNEAASGGKSSKIRPVAVALQAGDVLEIHTVAVGKKNPVASFPFGTYGGLVGLPKLPSQKPVLAGQLTAADRETVTLQDLPALGGFPERPQVAVALGEDQIFLRPYQVTDAILPGTKLGRAVKTEPVPGEKGRLLVTFELETLGLEGRETVTLPLSDTEAHRLGLVGLTGKLLPKGKIPVLQVTTLRASEKLAPAAPKPVAPLLPGRHPIAGPVAGFPKGADLKIVLEGEAGVETVGEFLLEGEGLSLRAVSDQVQVLSETGREGPGGLNAVLSPKTPEGTASQTGTMETKTWSLAQGDVVQIGDRFFAVKGKPENLELIPLAADPRAISKQEWERRAKEAKVPTRAYLEVSFAPAELEISSARVDTGPDGALYLTQGKGFTVVDAKGQRLTVLQQEATALQVGDKVYYDEGLGTTLPSKPVYLGEVVAGGDGKLKWKPAESRTAAVDREAPTELELPAVATKAPPSSLAKLTPVKLDALAAMATIEVGRRLAGFPLLGKTTLQEEPGRLTVSIGVPGRGYATELAENLAARLRKEHPQAGVKVVQGKDGAVFVIARAKSSDRVIAFNLRFKAEASPAPEDILAYAKQFEEKHGEKFAALAKGDVKASPESTFLALSSEYHAALRPREALQRLLEIGPKVRALAPEMEGRLLALEAALAKGSRADLAPDPELTAYLKAKEEMAVYEKTLREYEKPSEPLKYSEVEVEIAADRPGVVLEETKSTPVDREAVTEMDLPVPPTPVAPPWSGLMAGLHQIALQAVPYLPLMPVFFDAVLSQGLLGGGAQLAAGWFGKIGDKMKGWLSGPPAGEAIPVVFQAPVAAKIALKPVLVRDGGGEGIAIGGDGDRASDGKILGQFHIPGLTAGVKFHYLDDYGVPKLYPAGRGGFEVQVRLKADDYQIKTLKLSPDGIDFESGDQIVLPHAQGSVTLTLRVRQEGGKDVYEVESSRPLVDLGLEGLPIGFPAGKNSFTFGERNEDDRRATAAGGVGAIQNPQTYGKIEKVEDGSFLLRPSASPALRQIFLVDAQGVETPVTQPTRIVPGQKILVKNPTDPNPSNNRILFRFEHEAGLVAAAAPEMPLPATPSAPADAVSPLDPGSYVWDAGLDIRYLPESTDVAIRHPDLTGEDVLALLHRDGQDFWVLPRNEIVQVLDAAGRPLGLERGFDSQTGESISWGYRVPEQAYLRIGDKLYARQGTMWSPLQQDPWSGRSFRQTGDLEFEILDKDRLVPDAGLTPAAGPMPVPEIRAAAVVDPGAQKFSVEKLPLAVQDNLPDKPRRAAFAQNEPTFAYGSFAAHTDEGLGGKSVNEDAYGVLPEYGVAIVADGMGGMGGGDKASAVAVRKLAEIVKNPSWVGDLKQALIHAGRAVNEEVNPPDDPTKNAGTTAVAQRVVQKNGRTYAEIAHVGDAGALVLRPKPDGGFEVVFATREQSLVAQWRDLGSLKNTMEMRWSPHSHVVSGGLGLRKDAKPEFASVELQPGDWTLLFSDGIGDNFSKDELSVLVQGSKTPEEAREKILAALRLKMECLQIGSEQLKAGQNVFLVPVREKGADIQDLNMVPIDGLQDYYLDDGGKVVGRAVQFKDAQGQVRTGVEVPWAKGRFAVRNTKGEMEYFQGEAVQGLDYFLPVDRYKADNISIHVYKHELLPPPVEEEWRIDDVLDETPQTLDSEGPATTKMQPVPGVVPPPPTVKLAPIAEEIPPTHKLLQAVSAPKHPEETGAPSSPILARVGTKEIDLSAATKEPQVVYREGPVVVELSVDAIGRYLLRGRGFNWGSKPVMVEFEGKKFQLSRMKPSAPPLEVKSVPPPDVEKTHVAIAVGTSDFKTGLSESKGELAASDLPLGVEMELMAMPTALWDRDSDKNEVRVEDVLAEKPVSVGTLTREEAGGLTLQLRKELPPAYLVDFRDASGALKKGSKGSNYDPIALAEGDRIGIGPMGIMKFVVAKDETGGLILRPDGIDQKVRVHLSAAGIVSAKSDQPSPFKKMIEESMKDKAPEAPALPALSPEERLALASNVSSKERLGIVRDDKLLSDPRRVQEYVDSTKRLLGPTLSEQLGFLLVDSPEARAKIQKLREAVARRAGHSYPNVTKLREYAAEALLQEGIDISERALKELGLGKSLGVVNLTLGEAFLPQLYPNDVPVALISEERKAWTLGDAGFSGLFHPQHPAILLPGTTLGEIRAQGYLEALAGNMLVAGHQFSFKPYPGAFNPAAPIAQLEGQLFSFRQSVDVRAVFTFTSLANPKHQVVVEGPLGTDAKLAIEVARSSVKQTGKATALEDVIPLLLLENPQNIPVKLPLELRAFQILGWIAEQNEKTPRAYSMLESVKDLVDKWGDPIDNNNTLVDMEFYDRYSLSLRAKDRSHAESLLKMVQDSYGAALDPKQVIGPEPFSDAKGQGLSFRLTLSQASGALSNGKMLEIKVYAPN